MTNPIEKKENTLLASLQKHKSLLIAISVLIAFTLVLLWALFNVSFLWTACKNFISLFLPIIYGFIIAYILNIFMRPLENLWDKLFAKRKKRFVLKRAVCLVTSVILVVVILFAVLFLILPTLTDTVYSLMDSLPEYLDYLSNKFTFIKSELSALNIQFHRVQDTLENPGSKLSEILPQIGYNFLNTTFLITTSVFSGIINFAVAFVFSLYMLAQKEKLCLNVKKLLYAFVPKKAADKTVSVVELINNTFSRFAAGQFTEALILGVLCFIGMKLLSFPYAMAISALVGATALIPIVGAWIGVIVGAILIMMVSPIKALWFILFILVLQQIEGNLIYPRVMGKSIGLPGILVLAAISIGGNAYGVLGMLLGVPVFSVIYVLLKQFTELRLKEKKIKIK